MVGPDGTVRSLVKSREEGCRDGSLVEARLHSPRGWYSTRKAISSSAIAGTIASGRSRRRESSSTLVGGGPTGEDAKATWHDGIGTEARFFAPCGLAIDNKDNLYVADAENHRIRKITPGAAVTTIAGSGASGKEGGGFADGPAAQSRLNTPLNWW